MLTRHSSSTRRNLTQITKLAPSGTTPTATPRPQQSCSATCEEQRQAEQTPYARVRQRWAGIQAANDAVAEHLRATGTRNYQAAFAHVQRTRPELFARMQLPAGLVAAGNFNPYHDKQGRFTTKDGAADGRNDGLDGQGGGQTKPASIARYPYPREGKQNYNRCPLYSLQTIIAAKIGKEAPSVAEVQAHFDAEATRLSK